MKDFFKLLPFQINILFSSKLKMFISLVSALAIPIFFYPSSALKAAHNIDVYMTLPAMILFSEIFNLEFYHETIDILYCKTRKKTLIVLQRVAIILISLMVMSVMVLLMYMAIYPQIASDPNFTLYFVLKLLYSVFCTLTFFGALTMTITNLFSSYFSGIGISLFAFVIYIFVDVFKSNTIYSMFVFEQHPIWPWSKLFYLSMGIVLMVINNFIINSSPYNLPSFKIKFKIVKKVSNGE